MSPGAHNFTIYAGATFLELVEWRDGAGALVDLNDYTARMQIRDEAGALLHELTTANGGVAPQVDKRARLFIDDDDTRLFAEGGYFYDLLFEAIANDVVTPLLKGKVKVVALVTTTEP